MESKPKACCANCSAVDYCMLQLVAACCKDFKGEGIAPQIELENAKNQIDKLTSVLSKIADDWSFENKYKNEAQKALEELENER